MLRQGQGAGACPCLPTSAPSLPKHPRRGLSSRTPKQVRHTCCGQKTRSAYCPAPALLWVKAHLILTPNNNCFFKDGDLRAASFHYTFPGTAESFPLSVSPAVGTRDGPRWPELEHRATAAFWVKTQPHAPPSENTTFVGHITPARRTLLRTKQGKALVSSCYGGVRVSEPPLSLHVILSNDRAPTHSCSACLTALGPAIHPSRVIPQHNESS